jgi:hypothetical protein
MSNLSADLARSGQVSKWGTKKFLAADSTTFYKGAAVGLETTSGANQGRLVPCVVAADSTVVAIGICTRGVVTTTNTLVEVDLQGELELHRWDNASSSVSATSLGSVCYFSDDHSVTLTSTNNPIAGRVYGYDSVSDTVLVKKLDSSTFTAAGEIAANQVAEGTAYQIFRTNSAGTASEWAQDINSYAAINATNDITINVTQGFRRKITACGDTKAVTLASTSARAGDEIHITRPAIGATTANTIVNGGTGAGTLLTMTSNKAAGCVCMFDGTDWSVVSNYQGA